MVWALHISASRKRQCRKSATSELIGLKLGSSEANPVPRARDRSDVIELILRNQLPANYMVGRGMRLEYVYVWRQIEEAKNQEKK